MKATLYVPTGISVEIIDREPAPVPAPTITGFAATPATITAGQSVTLNATVTGAASLSLNGSPIAGLPLVVTPLATMTYTLEATGNGSASASLTVTVTAQEPAPAPSGAENPLLVYDGSIGLTRDSLYLKLINWQNTGGDWTDSEGTAQGSAPFAQARVVKASADAVRLDATRLVQSFALGEDIQVCVRSSAIMSFRSRAYASLGPALDVTYTDGTTATLYAVADAECNPSTAYEMGGNPALGLSYSVKAYIRFPAAAKQVASATLVLVPNYINETGNVSLYRFALHLDRLQVIEPYTPLTDCFVETEAFRKGTVPYPTYARIARESGVAIPDAAWKQWEWVPVDGGEALQITFDPRGSSALNSSIPFPGGDEVDEVVWEFDIRMMPDMLTGARDGFKLFAGVSSKTKSDDNYFVNWCKTPELLGTFGTLAAGNGGSKANGYDGWSLRFDAWNSPPDGHPMRGRFLPMQYAYHPEQIDYYGDPWSYSGQNTAFVVGQWHTVRQRAKINTVIHTGMGGLDVRKDAELDAWLDGLPVLRKRNFRLRTTLWPVIGRMTGSPGASPYYCVPRTNLAIGRIWLNAYHGGTTTPLARCSFQVRNFRAKIIKPTAYVPPLT